MKNLITVAALGLVTACAAQALTGTPAGTLLPAAPLPAGETLPAAPRAPESFGATCDIRETRTARGLLLEAGLQADQPVRGRYDFVITALSRGGSSDIIQGGAVNLLAGENAAVGAAEIPAGSYRAVLTLSNAGGPLCRIERRSQGD